MKTITLPNFEEHRPFGHLFFVGRLSADLTEIAREHFEELWNLHPAEFHEATIQGRTLPLPRWQQAYLRDYRYTGSVNKALPLPDILAPFHAWARVAIDNRVNGLLLNWYDPARNHYIGAHRDSRIGLVPGAPIVTISVGDTRTFRIRPFKEKGHIDFEADHGAVFVMPFATNLVVKHEVPHTARARGRRISITARAFQ